MKTERIELAKLKLNEANPRQIREGKFGKLVESLLVFPGMMELRPIVHDTDGTILGGNMRYRALLDIAQMGESAALSRLERVKGWEQRDNAKREAVKSFWGRWFDKPFAYSVKASELTDEEKREFIVKDNAAFGEWDWDMLTSQWDAAELRDWGVDFPKEWADAPESEASGKESKARDMEPFDVEDRIYDSDNEFDVPSLRLDRQPTGGLLLPFSGWGQDAREKKGIRTYHFYVEDYRFAAIWKHPARILESGCMELVEPNLSLFDTTPVAYGLHLIYMKRWIARFWQECGASVYADLNVGRKFREYNLLGIPDGYNAFATRGYADREEYLKQEIGIARRISGLDKPNMIVYGGGEHVREICLQSNVLYVEQFMANRNKRRKGAENG